MSPKTIDEFNNLNYHTIIMRKSDEFVLHLAELHLFAKDESLDLAYQKLETVKRELFENYFATNNIKAIPLPKYMAESKELKNNLQPFFIKLGAFAIIAILLISGANISLSYSLQQAPKKVAQKAGRAAINNFGSALEKLAKNEFTPEKEEKIRNGIKKLVIAIKPYMNEFEPLYRQE